MGTVGLVFFWLVPQFRTTVHVMSPVTTGGGGGLEGVGKGYSDVNRGGGDWWDPT